MTLFMDGLRGLILQMEHKISNAEQMAYGRAADWGRDITDRHY
jgi:hypothetical protein